MSLSNTINLAGFWGDKNGDMQANAIKALSSLVLHAVAPEVRLISARALHNLNTLNRTYCAAVFVSYYSNAIYPQPNTAWLSYKH